MHLRRIILLLILLVAYNAYAQQETYFYKIQEAILSEHLASRLYNRLDSLEKTRRPNDSYIKIFFNRDVDFGYKHERLNLKFNGTRYQVNLLTKNDTICFGSNIFNEPVHYYELFNKIHSKAQIDSTKALRFLQLRNQFYNSSKSLKNLKSELELDEFYVLKGGDGYNDTWEKLHLDTLVRERNLVELELMLKNINCEEQMYGVTGFILLKNNKVRIPQEDVKIILHIKKRNSDLESCAGDICPIIWKAYK